MTREDYTKRIAQWLEDEHELNMPEFTILMMAGLQWGLALAAHHSEYAAEAHEAMTTDYKERIAGSVNSFDLMASGDMDIRTSPEKLADGLAEAIEVFHYEAK